MEQCACGNKKPYETCCKPFITGKAFPQTAEQLMRSRYTAYTKGKINYIKKTSRGDALKKFDATRAKAWSKSANWLGLSVISTKQGLADDNIGWVEFIATYEEGGKIVELHELSEFHKIDGVWFYVSGEHR